MTDPIASLRDIWVQDGLVRSHYYIGDEDQLRHCAECEHFGNDADPHSKDCAVGRFEAILYAEPEADAAVREDGP